MGVEVSAFAPAFGVKLKADAGCTACAGAAGLLMEAKEKPDEGASLP